MSLLVRAPGDEFTFRLFFKLAATITGPKDIIYLWSSKIDPGYVSGWWNSDGEWISETELNYRHLLLDSIKTDLIIIGIKDHLTSGEFDSQQHEIPAIAGYLKSLFELHSNKKFILFTSVENLEAYISLENVSIVPWGGDITNHQKEYILLDPVLEKNFHSNITFLSLNRNPRTHRAMLVSLLYGLDINKHGLISCMFKDQIENLMGYTHWQTDNVDLFENGFNLLKQYGTTLNDPYEIYESANSNVLNFKNTLVNYYKETFVEIIAETSYTELCYNITEKTLNSIYGCSFPILLCSTGSVAFLRSMGMDMFDDVIDHSYDQIEDPADRLYRAINDNIELLTNNQKTKDLWKIHQERFINNVDFAKKNMYYFYSTRTETLFSEAKNGLNI